MKSLGELRKGARSRKYLAPFLAFCLLLLPLPAAANEGKDQCPVRTAESRASGSERRSGLLCLDGVLGHWMPLEEARKVLEKARSEAVVREENSLLEKRLEVEKKRVLLLELDQKDLEKIAGHWKEAALTSAKALADQDRFSRSTWFSFGALAGVITSVVLAVSIHYITD